MARSNPIVRPILIALFSYLLTVGGTFNGLTDPNLGFLSLITLSAVFASLLLLHLLRGWRWTRTPLDAALAIWIIAIIISLVANIGDWRRIAIGSWYTGIYILLWYAMHDLLANRAVKKSMLVDALLIGSVYLIAIGYLQLYTAAINGWRYPSFFGLPRPVSLIGNTNSYASLLVLIVGLSAGRMIGMRSRFWRVVLAIYLLLALGQLFLTFSRGGWLGGAAAMGTAAVGWLWVNNLLSPSKLRERWRTLNRIWRISLVGGAVLGFAAAVMVGMIFIRSLDDPGRTTELRTYLWDVAIQMFRQQPVTGRGLYTYGKMQEVLVSIPPTTPHAHAHNLPLHVLGELGLLGAAAMIFSFVIIISRGWHNLRTLRESNPTSLGLAPTPEQGIFIAGLSVMIGYGVHLLFDTTVMMPSVAITGLIAILIVIYQAASPLKSIWNRLFSTVLFITAFAFLAAGFYSNNNYGAYVAIVKEGMRTEDYGSAARELDRVIQSDPQLTAYWWQQGILYGLAADAAVEGSDEGTEAARLGLTALEQVVAIEPQHAFAWANIAGLRRQLEDIEGTLAAYQQASELAPRSWQLALAWGQYAETNDVPSQAQVAYARAISALPAAALYPAVADSPIALPLTNGLALDGLDEVSNLYLRGDYAGALAAWDTDITVNSPSARHYVLRALIAHAAESQTAAEKWLSSAKTLVFSDDAVNARWVALGEAVIRDDPALLPSLLPESPISTGEPFLALMLYRAQFHRDTTGIDYLPQVGYEIHDPVLVRLVAHSVAQNTARDGEVALD
jgi:putative inorganic carbon (hco3(-)) transporter